MRFIVNESSVQIVQDVLRSAGATASTASVQAAVQRAVENAQIIASESQEEPSNEG